MCCLCIQFTHENTSERTILHLVKKNILGLVACTAKKSSYALENDINVRDVIDKIYQVAMCRIYKITGNMAKGREIHVHGNL